MKVSFSRILIFLGVISLVIGSATSFGMNLSYADNLEIIGTDLGLEVVPSGTKLFDLTNLNPGDRKEAKIDIKNNYTLPFEVFMRTERTSPQPQLGEADLFKQLILTIYLNNSKIYSGPMKDYATSNISLGNFNPNSEKELRAIVHLPGPGTGNEFQGKSLEVKWYFIAELTKSEDPRDPEGPRNPTRPTIPINSGGQTELETVEIIEDEIPKDIPEIEDIENIEETEEIENPKKTEEIEELIEIIEDDVEKGLPKLPKTGETSSLIYYTLGVVLISSGIGIKVKRNDME